MNQKIIPCFWFEKAGEEAFSWYASIFENGLYKEHNAFLISASIGGLKIWAINGGPMYSPNPTMSLYATFDSISQLEKVYEFLVVDGKIMMALDEYTWSDKYAWVEDRYGISWQLIHEPSNTSDQKIIPCLMYTGGAYGNAEADMTSYIELFPNSKIHFTDHYKDGKNAGKLVHGRFELDGLTIISMDSDNANDLEFKEGCSFVRLCDNQLEIDTYWDTITKEGEEGRCGWCKDRSGLSWQIIPSKLGEWMADPNLGSKVGKELQTMNKINIPRLLESMV